MIARLSFIFLFFFSLTGWGASPLTDSAPIFDVKKANQQFDRINLSLSVQNLNYNNLTQAINTLSELITTADQCVENAQKRLNTLDTLIKEASSKEASSTDTATKQPADLVYLTKEQKELAERQGQCRLFSIRAREAVDAYKTAITKLKKEESLTRGLPLWIMIDQVSKSPPAPDLTQLPEMVIPPLFYSFLFWIVLVSTSLLFSILLVHRIRKKRLARHYLHVGKLQSTHAMMIAATLISGVVALCALAYSTPNGNDILPSFTGQLFLFVLAFTGIMFFFKLKSVHAFFYWYALDEDFFHSLILVSLGIFAAATLTLPFNDVLLSNKLSAQLNQSLFLLTVLAVSIYYVYYFCRVHRHYRLIKQHHRLIKRMIAALLIGFASLDVLGFHNLAEDLSYSGFATVVILFFTLLITNSIHRVYLLLIQQEQIKTRVSRLFGYHKNQTFTEFLILKTTAQIIVIIIGLLLIGHSWEIATYTIQQFYTQMTKGIHVGNMTIYPIRMIFGLIVFCLFYLFFRAISTRISRYQQFEDEEETQVAIASILTYLGFAVAAISGLLVAGFDFTGLAIIAGALSVGIGLGLQSIVNNFVSGIILLIEKPIQPGDRISVDGVEGFVKKIRVRSTQLVTPAREDIVIPNSDLITRRVTNYTFSDSYWRITCDVGVAYGTDTHLVRDVLLAIANNHPEVIKGGRNKPAVVFRSFGDSALDFQLSCLIKDVNKKMLVHSELNFAIEAAFREKNINMPFPQREITIKFDDASAAGRKD